MLLHILLKAMRLFRQLEAYWRKTKLPLKSLSHPICDHTKDFFPRKVFKEWITIPVKLVLSYSFEIILV